MNNQLCKSGASTSVSSYSYFDIRSLITCKSWIYDKIKRRLNSIDYLTYLPTLIHLNNFIPIFTSFSFFDTKRNRCGNHKKLKKTKTFNTLKSQNSR